MAGQILRGYAEMSDQPLSSDLRLSHYIVAWGSTSGSQVLNYRTEKAALRDAIRFDLNDKLHRTNGKNRVFAVYVMEIKR
jgi:hypothetical protein